MLPELIYREEKKEDYSLLMALGAVSVLFGFAAAKLVFPSEADILTVVFAAIPLVYPLTQFFLEDEKENRSHIPEIQAYSAIFVGEVIAFLSLGFFFPESFSIQASLVGASGFASNPVSFIGILANNMVVFSSILLLAALIGSAGAFVLTWNASVLGMFLARLISGIPEKTAVWVCEEQQLIAKGLENPSPLCYFPHATFEMAGFIVAGIAGSLISAALYREHFDRETWENLTWLTLLGIAFVVTGASLEGGQIVVFLLSLGTSGFFGYKSLM